MLRLSFVGSIDDVQLLKVPYASECKVPDEREKRKGLVRVCKSLLRSKAKPSPPKHSENVIHNPKLLRNLLKSA